MNKKGNWNLSAILGISAVGLIIISFTGIISKLWIFLGILFLFLAFKANH